MIHYFIYFDEDLKDWLENVGSIAILHGNEGVWLVEVVLDDWLLVGWSVF